MREMFSMRGLDGFEETLAVTTTAKDGDGVPRRGSVRATVILGAGLSPAAGPSVHSETADRASVIVRRAEWPYPFPPRLGVVFVHPELGELKVKGVTAARHCWTCRCSQNMRAGEK